MSFSKGVFKLSVVSRPGRKWPVSVVCHGFLSHSSHTLNSSAVIDSSARSAERRTVNFAVYIRGCNSVASQGQSVADMIECNEWAVINTDNLAPPCGSQWHLKETTETNMVLVSSCRHSRRWKNKHICIRDVVVHLVCWHCVLHFALRWCERWH